MPRKIPSILLSGGAGGGKSKPKYPRIYAFEDRFIRIGISLPLIIKQIRSPLFFTLHLLGLRPPKVIILEFRNGMKLTLRGGTSDTRVVLENIIWDIYCYDHPLASDRPITIIDIGGHIGTFSIPMAKKYPNSNIYVFEPFKENFDILSKNISQNGLEHIHPEMKAISGKKGTVSLNVSSTNTGGHSILYETVNSIPVETITLADVFESNQIGNCDLLKMDCEGAEYEIFFTLPDKYFERISLIVMEYHNTLEKTYADLRKLLEMKGFIVEARGKPTTEPYKIGVLSAKRR
jgi:FkbM family methyltransferase